MPADSVDVLIVGAGPTGLGAAWRLTTHGHRDWCVCEAAPSVGGLAASVVDGHGFTWDLGGHVQHSHYDYFDTLMDDLLGRDGWLVHERDASIRFEGRFVPYPFQLNLHRLPDAAQQECLAGLREAAAERGGTATNFAEWIERTFGPGITRLFMRPYNAKVWAFPLEEMSWQWIGDRVALVDLERVSANIAARRDDTGWGPNNRFRYPRRGGTGAIWEALAVTLSSAHPGSIRLSHRLVRIDSVGRTAVFDNGRSIAYRRLLTTMPLDEFVRLSDLHAALAQSADRLAYTSTHVLGFALHGAPPAALAGKCWIYFPEREFPFYRATVFSRYSPFNVPDASRFWSLLVEVSEGRTSSPPDGLEERTLQALLDARLLSSKEQVHHVWHRRLQRGYPVPTLDCDAALAAIHTALEARDIYSRGRFGAWKYEVSNQDHSVAQGVELVDRWLTGSAETTLNRLSPGPASQHARTGPSRRADEVTR